MNCFYTKGLTLCKWTHAIMTVKKEVAPASKAAEAEFFRGGQDISLLFVLLLSNF